jgi:hypothetical protein
MARNESEIIGFVNGLIIWNEKNDQKQSKTSA